MRRFNRNHLILILLLLIGPISRLMSGGPSSMMDMIISTLYMVPAIIVGISFHEYAHARVAAYWGDDTPVKMGRVTLDPRAHIDPLGLIALLLIHFGWGRPVMINPQRFRKRRAGLITVGLAGVAMNLIVAIVSGGILRLLMSLRVTDLSGILVSIMYYCVVINVTLMLFNLLPVPPLDGFGVISEIFRLYDTKFYAFVQQNAYWILMIMILFGVPGLLLTRPVNLIVRFIMTGIYGIGM